MSELLLYVAGVATLPTLSAVAVAGIRFVSWLEDRHGIAFEGRWSRDIRGAVERVGRYRLDHDIWWERSFGPVFVGGWYRESYIRGTYRRLFNRWVGLGPADGPNVMVFRKHDLGPLPAPAAHTPARDGAEGSGAS